MWFPRFLRKKQPSMSNQNTEGCYSLLLSSISDLTSLSSVLGAYMIIGLTPFLYFYDNPQKPILQDGILTRIVLIFSCN